MCTHVKSLKMKGEANISNTAQSIYVASNVLTLVGRQIEGIMWFRRRRHPNPEPLSRPLATDWEINRPTHVATHTCIKWPHHHSKWSSYVGRAQKSSKWEMQVWAMYQPQFGLRGCLCGCSCGRKNKPTKNWEKVETLCRYCRHKSRYIGLIGRFIIPWKQIRLPLHFATREQKLDQPTC